MSILIRGFFNRRMSAEFLTVPDRPPAASVLPKRLFLAGGPASKRMSIPDEFRSVFKAELLLQRANPSASLLHSMTEVEEAALLAESHSSFKLLQAAKSDRTPQDICSTKIEDWANKKQVDLAYMRYRRLMGEFGKTPIQRRQFVAKDSKFHSSPMDRFLRIEEKGFKSGRRVIHGTDVETVGTIASISTDARLIFVGEVGGKTPLVYELYKE